MELKKICVEKIIPLYINMINKITFRKVKYTIKNND